jgi:hypothetical protein
MEDEAHAELELHDGSTDEGEPGKSVPHPRLLEQKAECLPGLRAVFSPTHSISW